MFIASEVLNDIAMTVKICWQRKTINKDMFTVVTAEREVYLSL